MPVHQFASEATEKTWKYAFDLSWIISGLLLVACYGVALVHTIRGNQNSWLIRVVSMLLASAVASLITGYSFIKVHFNALSDSTTIPFVICLGFGLAIHYAAFGVAHYLIAVRYRSMAINVPLVLQGMDQKVPSFARKVAHWIVIALNTIAPIAYGALGAIFRYNVLVTNTTPSKGMTYAFNVALDMVALL
jgi:hypothetical protein